MPLNKNGKIDIVKLKEMMQNNYSSDKDNTTSGFYQFNEVLSEQTREIWFQLLKTSNSNNWWTLSSVGASSI